MIEYWKEYQINKVEISYEYNFNKFFQKDIEIYSSLYESTNDIFTFLKDYIFQYCKKMIHVEMFETKIGHYIGENGLITVTLENDNFVYNKLQLSQMYEENKIKILHIKLNDEQIKLIKLLENVNFDCLGDVNKKQIFDIANITFRNDMVLNDTLINNLSNLLHYINTSCINFLEYPGIKKYVEKGDNIAILWSISSLNGIFGVDMDTQLDEVFITTNNELCVYLYINRFINYITKIS